jgi:hypothetical protein
MLIHWIVDGVTGSAEAGYASTLASNRYRAIIPAFQLQREGHSTRLVNMSDWTGYSADDVLPDVCIVGKLLPSKDPARFGRLSLQLLNGAATASALGVTVIGDFSDDHFDNPQVGSYWRALANQVDICTTGADVLATSIRKHTTKPVVTVGDPLASPEGVARVFQLAKGVSGWMQNLLSGGQTANRLKLVWYGNAGNWMAMQQWAQALPSLAKTQPLLIWIVTRPDAAIETYVNSFNLKNKPSALMELVPWDEISQWSIVADADIVLIPSDLSSKSKAAKSANRLTDALNAGRFVVASPIAAYEAYRPYVCLTDEPIQAINEYLANPVKALKMIADGQVAARTRCGTAQVGSEWLRAFLLKSPAQQNTVKPSAPALPNKQHHPLIRLNLGCGDKILPDFINVDVVEARAGKSPDVICDLHALTCFEDNYADEVMAIHVVEHFWRWEIEQILREWLRVLKAGGKMVLECPNLLSACEALLAEPEKRSQQDKAGQTSMWVFYGDPGWKDPLMIHRWGYTPYSLAQLMTSVGLVNVRQEAAVYKLREPRDMRLVGEKSTFEHQQ